MTEDAHTLYFYFLERVKEQQDEREKQRKKAKLEKEQANLEKQMARVKKGLEDVAKRGSGRGTPTPSPGR